MPQSCRVVVDEAGTIVAADDAYCALTGDLPERLIGSYVLAATPEEDRPACYAGFARLRETGERFTVVRRIIRRDGSHRWVHITVREAAPTEGERRFTMDFSPCEVPSDQAAPEQLLASARAILAARRHRSAIFGTELFPDLAWDILLAVYIAEAEGRTIDLAGLHAQSGASLSLTSRWIKALHRAGLVDYEGTGFSDLHTPPLRLSLDGHRKFEAYIGSLLAAAADTAPEPSVG